ncbi:MAG: class I SAM-dependent methyltransferase [Chromatiaceae bacterium]|nr:class I SAM-dependent methyltransferase [Gammaproteobacteria bacterium]MCP5305408.1 class I SAM-dependent methyltransferase [Chromatiaceae bacterium]MCP5315367.1 class I SAM-dependent methyltransferase [Chromatiaceae bacterium]
MDDLSSQAAKRFAADPDHDAYLRQWADLYEGKNYDEGLTGYFLGKSHEWCERRFGPDTHFARVLEVGAGTGVHIKFVRHTFDEYLLTDLNPPFLDNIDLPSDDGHRGRVQVQREDAAKLSFADNSFDRVIAAHVLEHLYRPHEVLREWVRVLKPGGVLSLVLPCDPGLAWRAGRYLVARRKFNRAGLQYDYWMAREHVNPINNLVTFVRHYFDDVGEQWLPARLPSIDLNLFYICHARV